MLIVWDEPKRSSNLDLHGFDFADVRDHFSWKTAQVKATYAGEDGRLRFVAVGFLGQQLVTFVFSPLGTEAISVISLRAASRSERRRYAAS